MPPGSTLPKEACTVSLVRLTTRSRGTSASQGGVKAVARRKRRHRTPTKVDPAAPIDLQLASPKLPPLGRAPSSRPEQEGFQLHSELDLHCD